MELLVGYLKNGQYDALQGSSVTYITSHSF